MTKKFFVPFSWTVFVIVGSLISGNTLEKIPIFFIPHLDKFIHFIWYFILFLLWYNFLINKNVQQVLLHYRIILLVTLLILGFSLELFQQVIVKRSFEITDIIFNSLGVLFGFITFFPIYQNPYLGRFF